MTLSYADRGEASGPPLVLLPGPADSWRSYQPVLDRFPQGVRAVAVSQRGHGDSDKPATGYGVDDFAGSVVPLLDALDIERAVLTGHSGSCLVARRVALDHPGRVAGLILEASPTTLRNHTRLCAFVESVVSDLDDPIDPDFARSFLADTSFQNVTPEVVDQLVEEMLKVPARVWKETFAGLLPYDDMNELPLIEAPTVLVWGDADTLVSRGMQVQLARSIPAADLLIYPRVGHTPRWEDPARFASDIVKFVRSIRAQPN
jgi:pimeloyl-ACP methyl ester carboxylesterase